MGTSISIIRSMIDQGFPPKSKFSVNDIPDLAGQVVIVTGANTGVGKETAKALLNHNAKVYFAARDKERAEQAIKDLKEETGKEGIFLQLDLSDLPSVKRAAEEFLKLEPQLHILFNNAGVMAPPVDQLTKQGYDLQFGTNVLGHWYFTKLVLPALLAPSKATSGKTGRVIHTSSSGSLLASTLKFETFKDHPSRTKAGTEYLYTQNLQRHLGPITKKLVGLVLYPTPYGALTQLWAGTSEEGVHMNGKYLIPWARYGTANPVAQDEKLGRDLWTWLQEQVDSI
ncbi:hypothetical protein DFP72DRAFT_824718 [Ephemerocybe angulata]|uniref:NAD(P)-binding protein n=1 Tax=Ephemerocybe angulata TaxID=980116 RepID=A0A8H6HDS6_9AGAR|nr:hypothetical protein DFP72DRAFT_824718 [Tulosesus angulatus]